MQDTLLLFYYLKRRFPRFYIFVSSFIFLKRKQRKERIEGTVHPRQEHDVLSIFHVESSVVPNTP